MPAQQRAAAQHAIAVGVAVAVVQQLEVVDVDQEMLTGSEGRLAARTAAASLAAKVRGLASPVSASWSASRRTRS